MPLATAAMLDKTPSRTGELGRMPFYTTDDHLIVTQRMDIIRFFALCAKSVVQMCQSVSMHTNMLQLELVLKPDLGVH